MTLAQAVEHENGTTHRASVEHWEQTQRPPTPIRHTSRITFAEIVGSFRAHDSFDPDSERVAHWQSGVLGEQHETLQEVLTRLDRKHEDSVMGAWASSQSHEGWGKAAEGNGWGHGWGAQQSPTGWGAPQVTRGWGAEEDVPAQWREPATADWGFTPPVTGWSNHTPPSSGSPKAGDRRRGDRTQRYGGKTSFVDDYARDRAMDLRKKQKMKSFYEVCSYSLALRAVTDCVRRCPQSRRHRRSRLLLVC